MPHDLAVPSFRALSSGGTVKISFEGATIDVPQGSSVAAALLLHGMPPGRFAAGSQAQRCAYCLIGQCFECTMTIDGVPCRQACLTTVADGMTVERQVA